MPTPLSAIPSNSSMVPRAGSARTTRRFPHRYDYYNLYIHPATDDPADAAKIVDWGRECWDTMQPFVERAVYVNAMEDAGGKSEQPARDAYGPNFERLAALKKRYDPANFLTGNQNIKPSA
jgi:FAD/FMN-containing dehydrogenase